MNETKRQHQGRIQELGAGGGGTGEGVAGGGARLDAPGRVRDRRGYPSRPARGSGGALLAPQRGLGRSPRNQRFLR